MTGGPAAVTAEDGRGDPPQYPFAARDGVDPDPQYAALRGAPTPVVLSTGRAAWLVTRMADVRVVHTDARFSRAAAVSDLTLPTAGLSPPAGSLLALDPPDHGRVRRLVAGAFSARRTDALRPRVRAAAEELLAPLPADGTVDLVPAYTRALSVRVVGDLLGVPASDHEMFAGWSDALLSTTVGAPDRIGRLRGAVAGYLRDLIGRKAAEPADDLLSHLAAQRVDDPRELIMLAMAVLVAGHETTSNLLGSALLLVLGDRELAAGLRADPDRVPLAVEELLRYVSLGSVGGFPRVATADVELGGASIRAGDVVVAALNAANRDPAEFPDPDRFDAGRGATAHVAFGAGPHFCLGASLARIELAEGISALLATRPRATPAAGAGSDWHQSSLVRGLAELPVRLGPSAPTGKDRP